MAINIRKAEVKDFDVLYKLGLDIAEFKVSLVKEFMKPEDFMYSISNPLKIFLLAEENSEILGFMISSLQESEEKSKHESVYIEYIGIKKERRNKGIGQTLYDTSLVEFKKRGLKYIASWVNAGTDSGILKFMKRNGFNEGHKFIWMDKNI